MTSEQRLKAAEKATSNTIHEIARAQTRLALARDINAAGIFASPQNTRAYLDTAAAAIRDALAIIAATDWPTDADYDTL